MNTLKTEKQIQILSMLCEGQSIRGITRIMGVDKNTVMRLFILAGKASLAYHDKYVRNLRSENVQCDEIWAFTYSKQKNVVKALAAPQGAGDTWTWTAIDADSKLIISYLVGERNFEQAKAFLLDIHSRLETRIQLTTDGYKPYLEAVEEAFGADVDYGQIIKFFGKIAENIQNRYSPPQCKAVKKKIITGNPDRKSISTSYIERQNLTMRMHMRRFTRLTNAFSKKFENHIYAVALHFMYYNFVKIHSTLKVTPAMEAGISKKCWEMQDILDLALHKHKTHG